MYFKSAVIEYVRTSRYTRRAPIRIRGNSSPNTWLFVQCFEDWIVQKPAPPLGLEWYSHDLPYRAIYLSNAPPKEQLSSPPVVFSKACVLKCQHMFRDPLYDDAVFTRLKLLQKL